jgi:transcription antitermination factor NusG
MTKNTLYQLLDHKKPFWYALVVYMGKEKEIRQKLLAVPGLNISDTVIPENLFDKTDDDLGVEAFELYQYYLGYMFINFTLSLDTYHRVLEVPSVYRFLGELVKTKTHFIYIPSKVKEKEIDIVKNYLSGKKYLKCLKFKPHDNVLIKKGDLADIQGSIIEVGKTHVKILPNSTFFTKTIIVPIENVVHC